MALMVPTTGGFYCHLRSFDPERQRNAALNSLSRFPIAEFVPQTPGEEEDEEHAHMSLQWAVASIMATSALLWWGAACACSLSVVGET